MSREKGDFNFSGNLEVKKKATLDARELVNDYSQLLEFTSDDYLPKGFVVKVNGLNDISKRGLWMLIDENNLSAPLSWINLSSNINSIIPTYLTSEEASQKQINSEWEIGVSYIVSRPIYAEVMGIYISFISNYEGKLPEYPGYSAPDISDLYLTQRGISHTNNVDNSSFNTKTSLCDIFFWLPTGLSIPYITVSTYSNVPQSIDPSTRGKFLRRYPDKDGLEYVDLNLQTPTFQQVSEQGGFNNGSTFDEGSVNHGFGGGIARICVTGKEDQWENGVRYLRQLGGPTTYAESINEEDIPDLNYDITRGWISSSRFTNLVLGKTWKCLSSQTGNANWQLEINEIKNRVINISLSQLGIEDFDEITDQLLETYINSQNYVQEENETLYLNITELELSTSTFDETFDNTFQ